MIKRWPDWAPGASAEQREGRTLPLASACSQVGIRAAPDSFHLAVLRDRLDLQARPDGFPAANHEPHDQVPDVGMPSMTCAWSMQLSSWRRRQPRAPEAPTRRAAPGACCCPASWPAGLNGTFVYSVTDPEMAAGQEVLKPASPASGLGFPNRLPAVLGGPTSGQTPGWETAVPDGRAGEHTHFWRAELG